MTQLAPTGTTKKEFTVLMAALISIVAISIDALLPAFGHIVTDLSGITHPNQVQYVIVALFAGLAIGEIIAGPCSDAMGRKIVLYFGVGFYLAGSVICYFAQSLDMMLLGRFVQGIGVAGPYVSAVSIVRDKYSGRDMAKVMSLVMMIFMLVPAVAPSIGQGILYIGTWRDIFLLYIGYAILIAFWLCFRLEETLPPAKRIPFSAKAIMSGFKEVLTHPITASYTVCMGICFGSFIGYLNSSQQIFQVQFKTGEMFTVYFGLLALVLGASSLTNSRFVQRLGMHYLCVRAFMAIIITSAIFLAVHLIINDIQLWMFLLYAATLFFSFGLVFGNLNALAMEPMGHIAGIAAAVIGSVSTLVSMAIGGFIGQLYDNTLIPIIWGFLGFSVLSLIIMFYAQRKRREAHLAHD